MPENKKQTMQKRVFRGRLTPRAPKSTKGKPGTETIWVAGIGASAGGLEALKPLVERLPAAASLAFVIVQHMDKRHGSMLPEILSRCTPLPVLAITNGMPVQAGRIYIHPSGARLKLEGGRFRVRSSAHMRLPIDAFFRSLAQSKRNCSIGIILSGTGSDGVQGLKAIKASGGITFAQTESTAKFTDMPVAAIESGHVDHILSPEKIAEEAVKIPYGGLCPMDKDVDYFSNEDLEKIFRIIFEVSRVDFTHYKSTTVQRRIRRRMGLLHKPLLKDYLKHLRKNKNEAQLLYQDLLINVTQFFRDPDVFRVLAQKVFPEIRKHRLPHRPIRIWVPGCATGEEVYSIAIALFDFLGAKSEKTPIQIFGTDIQEAALEKARSGIYNSRISETVPPEYFKKYFTPVEGGYQIQGFVRDVCVFAKQDVTRDPPFSKLDLISCRNLLIYLEPALQKKVIPVFHYALNPSGYLLLGPSESLRAFSSFFDAADKKCNLYTKKTVSAPLAVNFFAPYHDTPRAASGPNASAGVLSSETDIHREMDRILNRYTPAAVLVSENMDVLHFRGKTERFLSLPAGKASLNLLKMVRGGLLYDLKECIDLAQKKKGPIRKRGVFFKLKGVSRQLDLEVVPVASHFKHEWYFLVIFNELSALRGPAVRGGKLKKGSADQERAVQLLEKELEATREYLEANLEQQERANEELRSANEEVVSSNEELQSTNEEMETAKEELQSANEELTTINEALSSSLDQLKEANEQLAEAQGLAHLGSWIWHVDTNTVMLSDELWRIYGLKPGGLEMDFDQFLQRVHPEDFEITKKNIQECLKTKKPFSFEHRIIRSDNKVRTLQARGRLLRDEKGKALRMSGTGQDITDFKEMKAALMEGEQRFRSLVGSVRDYAIFMLDTQGRITTWNAGAQRFKGYSAEEIIGKKFNVFYGREDRRAKKPERELEIAKREGSVEDEGWRIRKDGTKFWANVVITAIRDSKGQLTGFAKVTRDLTERRRMEQELRDSRNELEKRVSERTRELAESEGRYQDFYQNAPEMFLSVDPRTFKIFQCNDTLLKSLGYSRKQLIGSSELELIHPDDRKFFRKAMREFLQAGNIADRELRVRRCDGASLTIILNATAVRDAKGRILYTRSVWRDITQRKQMEDALRDSEESFRQLADGMPQIIWTAGSSGRPEYYNARWYDYTGLRPGREENGNIFIHPEDRETTLQKWKDSVSRGVTYETEYRLKRVSDGMYRWHLGRGVPIRAADGRIFKWIGTATDIHERKRFENNQRFLSNASREFARSLEFKETLHKVAELSVPEFADWCAVDVLNEEKRCLDRLAVVHRDPKKVELAYQIREKFPATLDNPSIVEECAVSGEAKYGAVTQDFLNAMAKNKDHLRMLRSLGLSAYITVPLMCKTGVRGAITFVSSESQRVYDPVDVAIAEDLARHASLAIDNSIHFRAAQAEIEQRKNAQKALQENYQILDTINSVGKSLSAELRLENLVQAVTDAATHLTNARFGAFFYNVINEQGKSYSLFTVSGLPRDKFEKFPMPRATEIFAPTFRGEGIVRLGDVTRDPRYGKMAPHHGMPAGHPPVKSYLAVPVISRSGEVLGGLFFGHEKEDVFQESHEKIVEGLAAQAAIAIDNAHLYESLQKELAERSRTEEALVLQTQELFRSNEDLRQFAYIASHDLQEPLRTVSSFTELLNEQYRGSLEGEGGEYIKIITESARRAQMLVTDLLDYCRVERRQRIFETVDTSRVVESVKENLKASLAETGARIHYAELPTLKGDEIQLVQLFQNLIGNAVKFRSPERTPEIWIKAEKKEAAWLFSVRDNGIGIDAQYINRIFIIFQRLHTQDKYPGTGIGLAICKKIVEAHGGQIWVESEAGRGSVFCFTLSENPGAG